MHLYRRCYRRLRIDRGAVHGAGAAVILAPAPVHGAVTRAMQLVHVKGTRASKLCMFI